MAMEVHCLLCWAARSSTLPLASYPVTEHSSTGVLALIWGREKILLLFL